MTSKGRLEGWQDGEVRLTLFREFELFDVKTTPVLYAPLSAHAREARNILADRIRQEIKYARMLVEWVAAAPLEDIIGSETPESKALLAEMTGYSDETLPRRIQRRQRLIDLQSAEPLPNARWQDLYAALALAFVARAVTWGHETSIEAAEAIQIALSFSQRSKSASNRSSSWKEQAIRFDSTRQHLSAEQVAGMFLKKHDSLIRADRNGKSVAKRTVVGWIRNARKSNET